MVSVAKNIRNTRGSKNHAEHYSENYNQSNADKLHYQHSTAVILLSDRSIVAERPYKQQYKADNSQAGGKQYRTNPRAYAHRLLAVWLIRLLIALSVGLLEGLLIGLLGLLGACTLKRNILGPSAGADVSVILQDISAVVTGF